MIAPATQQATLQPGTRVLAHIVARYEYRDFRQFGGEVQYLDACFKVDRPQIVEITDPRERLALIELDCTVIKATGLASYALDYNGHVLRVHAQQVSEVGA